MSIWDALSSGRPRVVSGDGGWYLAGLWIDDYPLGPFATKEQATFALEYACGLEAVLAIDKDARASVSKRHGLRHARRFQQRIIGRGWN